MVGLVEVLLVQRAADRDQAAWTSVTSPFSAVGLGVAGDDRAGGACAAGLRTASTMCLATRRTPQDHELRVVPLVGVFLGGARRPHDGVGTGS